MGGQGGREHLVAREIVLRRRGEAKFPAHAVLHHRLIVPADDREQPRARGGAGADRVGGEYGGEGGAVDGHEHRPRIAVPRHARRRFYPFERGQATGLPLSPAVTEASTHIE